MCFRAGARGLGEAAPRRRLLQRCVHTLMQLLWRGCPDEGEDRVSRLAAAVAALAREVAKQAPLWSRY